MVRRDSDFASFAPYLAHNFELVRRYIACFEGSDEFQSAYDVVLDDYEPRIAFSPSEVFVASLRRLLASTRYEVPLLEGAQDCRIVLVLAKGRALGEMPYPVRSVGLESARLADLVNLGRWTFELCGMAASASDPRADVQVVTVRDDDGLWHFVGGSTSMVALRSSSRADVFLSRALSVASGG